MIENESKQQKRQHSQWKITVVRWIYTKTFVYDQHSLDKLATTVCRHLLSQIPGHNSWCVNYLLAHKTRDVRLNI